MFSPLSIFSIERGGERACPLGMIPRIENKNMSTKNKATATATQATATATDTQATATAKAKETAKAKDTLLKLGQFRASIPRLVGDAQSANCAIGRVSAAIGKDSTAKRNLGADLASVSAVDFAAVRRLVDTGEITRKDAAIYQASATLAKAILALQSAITK
jgi:hypothetical protein